MNRMSLQLNEERTFALSRARVLEFELSLATRADWEAFIEVKPKLPRARCVFGFEVCVQKSCKFSAKEFAGVQLQSSEFSGVRLRRFECACHHSALSTEFECRDIQSVGRPPAHVTSSIIHHAKRKLTTNRRNSSKKKGKGKNEPLPRSVCAAVQRRNTRA